MSMKKPARQMQNVKFSEIAEKMETAAGFLSGDALATDHADVATLKEDVATMKAGTFSSGLSVTGSVEATGSIKADVDLEAVGDVKAGDDIIATGDITAGGDITATGAISAGSGVSVTGDISATGEVTANKISQAVPNAERSFEILHGDASEVENIYNKFIVVNGVMHIVILSKFTNTTQAAQTFFTANSSWIYCPSPEKVIDVTGHSAHEASSANIAIATAHAFSSAYQVNDTKTGKIIIYNTAQPDVIGISYRFDGSISIPAGGSMYVTARISLTLL